MNLVSMVCTSLVSVPSETSSGNTPFAMCIASLWQPDEVHQLLLGLVKDLLHWLLKYLKARNVKDQFDNRFTSLP